ncbi:putative outer membrane protein; OmpA/MotB domain [Cupriavidus taiwanensis]|uniref:Outer membrane protein OmpA/MotB domain n=2 Tax=Cupriavidus taiwanensis TaxID=164546 RepID=A0A375C7D3_9BURK|nr:putative outer membrane protein; OmpA/MotB domain [Cupriavidus taiwanensis]
MSMGFDAVRNRAADFKTASIAVKARTPALAAGLLAALTMLPGHAAPGDPGTTGIAAPAAAAAAASGRVVAGGAVPDEATKASVLARLRELYGSANVVDQIEVGNVVSPPNWSANVQKILSPQIKQVSRGQLSIDGTQVSVHGDVRNEAQRQQIASDMATGLGQAYTVKNGLRVPASEQNLLDQTLANRIIEFETGAATLTPKGRAILDEMAAVLPRLSGRKIEIVGHTDNSGSRALNLTLSQARAETVKNYLIGKGGEPSMLTAVGVGPDQPVAPNDKEEGRAKNRRIEFRAGQ